MGDKVDGRKNNGGARVGAGRPKANESTKKVAINVSVLQETADAIKVLAPNKKAQGKVVDKAIKKLLDSK